MQIYREKRQRKKIFHLLVHCPDSHNSTCYALASQKPRARTFLWASHVGAKSQIFGPFSIAF